MGFPLLDLFDVIGKVVDRVIPDPAQKIDLQIKLAQLADQEASRSHDEMMGQIEVNKVEAANLNVFVSGWRPAIGWGCGAALIYNTLVAPMFHLGMADLGFLQTVLMAMLGIGAMRSYDKKQGTETDLPLLKPVPTQSNPTSPPRKKFLGIIPLSLPGMS